MLARSKGIIFAVILGLLCPMFMIGMLQKQKPEDRNAIQDNTRTTNETEAFSTQIAILMQDGTIEMLDMNDYLTCVVLREMPASFEFEALKAQAVVARTYALRRIVSGGKHVGAAVCTNADCCQGFYDIEEYLDRVGGQESVDKIQNAVCLTDNLVLVYNGELIDATYFSCSGGMTEDAKAVWGTEVPYLISTESPGEDNAAHYVDTVTFTTGQFLELLDLKMDDRTKVRIGNITYTSGGGVDTINICGNEFKGTAFRHKLGLRSTAFVISVVGDTVTVTTKGFGHRVGMSQYGADAMAVGGAGFAEILAHYYHGTQLVTYNSN